MTNANRVLHLDCFSGAAGDMLLGACVDAGLPFGVLQDTIAGLGLDVTLRLERVRRSGIDAAKVHVVEGDGSGAASTHKHRHLPQILRIIDGASLPPDVKMTASRLFQRLGAAEAAVHGVPIEKIHFHEVGALDAIVDIVGGVFALQWFGAARITASALNTGSGTVRCAHGTMPVPAPATARLLEGVPVYAEGPAVELLTPTGALLVTGFAVSYGPPPPMILERMGYGAGDRDFPDRPNVVRLVVGQSPDSQPSGAGDDARETVRVIECELDDLNPQVYGALMARLFGAGALDVYYTPVQMKKNRPGTLVTVLATPGASAVLTDILFAETSTLGVRAHDATREVLDREVREVATPYGPVQVKIGRRRGVVVTVSPEFDACAQRAAEAGIPVKEVLAAAVTAWRERPGGSADGAPPEA